MIKKIRFRLRQYPLALAAVAIGLYYALSFLLDLPLNLLPEGLGAAALSLTLSCGLTVALTVALGYGWVFGRKGMGKTLGAGAGLFVPQALLFLSLYSLAVEDPNTQWLSREETLVQLLKLFTVAFWEETVFRGVIANAFGIRYGADGRGVWRAVILSGLVFGLMHLTNLAYGVPLLSALVQSAVAWVIGMLLAAVYHRGGCLWATVLIHFVMDAASLFSSSFLGTATDTEVIATLSPANLLPIAVFLPVTLFVLRPKKMPEALSTLAAHRQLDGFFPERAGAVQEDGEQEP